MPPYRQKPRTLEQPDRLPADENGDFSYSMFPAQEPSPLPEPLASRLEGRTFNANPVPWDAIIFGINTGANMTFFGYMWAEYFGRRHLGSIQGAGQTIGVVGASIGALPLGIAFDLFGSYDGVLRLLAILPLAAAIPALFLNRPNLTPEK